MKVLVEMNDKKIFLNGLNGIRTLAAFGVMISHINLGLNSFGLNDYSLFGFLENGKQKSWLLGEHGVTMFFVLSGFLITYLLYKEYKKTNTIKIKSFYIRRLLRIWPLYYAYFIITLLISSIILSNQHYSINNIFYYSFFLANIPFITETSMQGLAHLWSIAVEEQFYLFWPFLFLFLARKMEFKKVVLFLMIFQAVFRIFIWYKYPFSQLALFSVVNRFDCMMLGGLGAVLFLESNKIIYYLNHKITQYFAWVIMLLLILDKLNFFNSIIEIFLVSFVTLCIIIIIGQINVENRVVNLENKIMSYLGKLSFGIYVYHPLIILICAFYLNGNNFLKNQFFVVFIFILIIFLTIIISHISYFYFEIRFLKIKSKYSIIHSTNSKIDV